jgi:hypothetical protein
MPKNSNSLEGTLDRIRQWYDENELAGSTLPDDRHALLGRIARKAEGGFWAANLPGSDEIFIEIAALAVEALEIGVIPMPERPLCWCYPCNRAPVATVEVRRPFPQKSFNVRVCERHARYMGGRIEKESKKSDA